MTSKMQLTITNVYADYCSIHLSQHHVHVHVGYQYKRTAVRVGNGWIFSIKRQRSWVLKIQFCP